MSDPQSIYNSYIQQYGYAPKLPSHLIAHAKKSGHKLTFLVARNIINNSKSSQLPSKSLLHSKKQISTKIVMSNNNNNIPKHAQQKQIQPNILKTKNTSISLLQSDTNTVRLYQPLIPLSTEHDIKSNTDDKYDKMEKIDILLGKYYDAMGQNDYFIDGVGKFKVFCENNSHHINEIAKSLNIDIESNLNVHEEKINFFDIDNEFPFIADVQIQKQKEVEILKILKYLYVNLLNNCTYTKY
eukprot:453839_1